MASYFLKRLARALATIATTVLLAFVLLRVVPGDPTASLLGDNATAEERNALRAELGLDGSSIEQALHYVRGLATGSLGRSFRSRTEVAALLREAAVPTAELAALSMLWAILVSLVAGSLAGARQGRLVDKTISGLATLALAIPLLWLAPMLVYVFAVQLRWLPVPGQDAAGALGLILPVATLGTVLAASLTRQVREAVASSLTSASVLAARARGIPSTRLLFRHVLPNAALPVLTLVFAQVTALLGGAVVVERIFDRSGIGTLFLEAFFDRDLPILQAVVLCVTVTTTLANVLLDLCYAVADPRVRL